MKIAILNRYTQTEIFSGDFSTLSECVIAAVRSYANLTGANLTGASLSGASLSGANLTGANLSGADLSGASLSGANLTGANLTGANLTGANLSGASLSGADLYGASLSGASLSGADLSGADLTDADMEPVRVDFLAAVLRLPNELEFLRDTITAGKIDGSTYSGDCACLAGTFANALGVADYNGESLGECGFRGAASSPRERFFTAIRPGNTPENNGAAKLALEWTNDAIAIRDMIRAGK